MSTSTDPTTPAGSDAPAYRYTAATAGEVEARWQQRWADRGTFHAPNPVGELADGVVPADKLFVQDMFPYPSGEGLHVGHPLGFIATDVYARYHRMIGANVLHTMGFDAFGLPAEQYAVQTGTHPRTTTETNVNRYLAQIRRLGLGHDERRRVNTTDTGFYRWTQWIFLQIHGAWYDTEADRARPIAELEAAFADGTRTPSSGTWAELSVAERGAELDGHRLVHLSESVVNWCPGLGTVLANEEVTADGRSDRGNFPVFRKTLRQWMMRITAYSDRLIDDLAGLDWPDSVKAMQRNWIGRSRGAQVSFGPVEVFTTRPDTLFGATYVVLAPEHELVESLTAGGWPAGTDERWTGGAATPAEAVAAYRARVASKTDLERQENREKTGVFTGSTVPNPVNGVPVPVFLADYVLTGYGTGAIMAVPAHDQRDWDFATAFGLGIVEVVSGGDVTEAAWTGEGVAVASCAPGGLSLDGMAVGEAKDAVVAHLEAAGTGRGTIQYKLRDWLFARQRYWGEPFPIVYDDDGVAHALPDSALPVELPEVEDYAPNSYDPDDRDSQPYAPLNKATDWVDVELDLGDGWQHYRRDTNVMPQWAGSSWYQLRYIDPTNTEAFVDPANEAYWVGPRPELHGAGDPGGVDLYVGGVEHAVLHLLYSRFWHKVLFDLGHVSSSEPYRRLVNQGYIQAFAYTDARGVHVPAAEVVERDGGFFWTGTDGAEQAVHREYGKMGKSLKNSVSPDEMAAAYGADTLRVYEMSMGPLDTSRPWSTKDVVGAQRFLQRLWRTVLDEETGALRVTDATPDEPTMRLLHRTIAGVGEDYAALRNNTAASKLIELTNHLTKVYRDGAPRAVVEPLVLMLAPLAPHAAEELWSRLGHEQSLAHGPFPVAQSQWLTADTVDYPIQVNGKVRSKITVPAGASREDVQAAALVDPKILEILAGSAPKKVIVVPGRLVNLVV